MTVSIDSYSFIDGGLVNRGGDIQLILREYQSESGGSHHPLKRRIYRESQRRSPQSGLKTRLRTSLIRSVNKQTNEKDSFHSYYLS